MKHKHLLFLLIPFLIQCQRAPEISQWRGPNRDGFYPDKNLLKAWPEEGPELIWQYDSLGKGYTTVAVTAEKVYTTGTFDSTSYIFAFDHSGELLWKNEYGLAWMVNFPGARSTPLVYGDLGYLLSGRGKLVCFDADDGTIVWTKDLYKDFGAVELKFGMTENLMIDDGKLFCTPGGEEFNVVALNPESGDMIWKSKALGEPSAYCSPRMFNHDGMRYYTTITAKSIICLDPENGKLIWSHDLLYPHGIHGNTPIYHEGYVFAMNGWEWGSVMLKINEAGDGVGEVWKSKLFDLEHGDAMLINGNIYGTDYTTRHFSCVDWYTGQVKDSLNKYAPASVIAADGMIYAYSYLGDVALIQPNRDGFEVVSSFEGPGLKRDHIAHPVIHDGRLYIRYNNALRVYDISRN
jgi:outer membrane protein assembly factor BamB